MIQIAVFASGSGTNAEALVRHFASSQLGRVALIVTNNPEAGVIQRAQQLGVPLALISGKTDPDSTQALLTLMQQHGIQLIALAGYLKRIPAALVAAFPQRIVNIHPSLLPKFGGKGMYGLNVHKAVIATGEAETGITIHYVDEHYDTGAPIFQARMPVPPGATPEALQAALHTLEYTHYPSVLDNICTSLLAQAGG